MYETLRGLLALDDQAASQLRNDVLRLGMVACILGVYVGAVVVALRDGVASSSPGPSPEHAPSAPRAGAIRELLFVASLLGLVLSFPAAFAAGVHGLLPLAALALGLAFLSETRSHLLRFRPPAPLARRELVLLAGLCSVALALLLFRWTEVPIALNEDEAAIGISAREMWRQRLHPFYLNGGGVPALHDAIDGLFLMLSDDPRFGLRLQPMLWGLLSSLLLFRWLCWLGTPALAWIATAVFIATPAFQHYSRAATGSSLFVAQLVFLYGFTRALLVRGAIGPVLAGLALGLSHWNYYAARSLLLCAAGLPLLLLPYHRSLAPGWIRRVLLIGLVAAPWVLAFPIMKDYPTLARWTWSMTPPGDAAGDGLLPLAAWKAPLVDHFRMWFDPALNRAGWITVPGSPVLPFPTGAFALVGVGLLGLSIRRPAPVMLCWMLACGLAGSILGGGPPNGHRAITATVPAVVLVAVGLGALWPPLPEQPWAGLRRSIAAGMVLWCGVAGLVFLHRDMWKDPRTIAAQQYSPHRRADRVLRDVSHFDVRVTPRLGGDIDAFLLPGLSLPGLDWGNWLPPNWSLRPVSVQAHLWSQPLVGLPRSVLPETDWSELFDPAGNAAGWQYRTDGERLGIGEVARQWNADASVTGSLLIPDPGRLRVGCQGYRLGVSQAGVREHFEDEGEIPVLRGLLELRIEAKAAGSPPPGAMALRYHRRAGAPEDHALRPQDLYLVPVHGWLRCASDAPPDAGSGDPECAIFPVLATLGTDEVRPLLEGTSRTHVYSATAELPPGAHEFVLRNWRRPDALRVSLSGVELPVQFVNPEEITFALDPRRANGQRIEIHKLETRQTDPILLLTARPGGSLEVPPYSWFSPAGPVVPSASATTRPGRPLREPHAP